MNSNPNPDPCVACGATWARCEQILKRRGMPCCGRCHRNVTHNQDAEPTPAARIVAELRELVDQLGAKLDELARS